MPVIIDEHRCGIDGRDADLNATISWDECMEIREASGREIIHGGSMSFRPPICDGCMTEFQPSTAEAR